MEKRHKKLNRNKKYWGKNKGAKYTWKIQMCGNTGKSPKVDTKRENVDMINENEKSNFTQKKT